jgi:hypothetical protein
LEERVSTRVWLPALAFAVLVVACGDGAAEVARVEVSLEVDSRRYACDEAGGGCLWVREDGGDWRFLAREIDGFTPVAGEHYALRVDRPEDLDAADRDAEYALLEVVERAAGPPLELLDPFGAEPMLQVAVNPGGGRRLVRGFLFAPSEVQVRLCQRLTEDAPPRCPNEFMLLEGVNLDRIEGLEQDGDLRWSRTEVRVPGTTREVWHLLFGYRVALDVQGRVIEYEGVQ